jgi:hypothetical protein
LIPPFVLRIECDDPALARAIGRSLLSPLTQRGARVRLDGELMATGPRFGVSIQTTSRGKPGANCVIGIADAEGAAWVAPLELTEEPLAACDEIVSYLERWGFMTAGRASQQALS